MRTLRVWKGKKNRKGEGDARHVMDTKEVRHAGTMKEQDVGIDVWLG